MGLGLGGEYKFGRVQAGYARRAATAAATATATAEQQQWRFDLHNSS